MSIRRCLHLALYVLQLIVLQLTHADVLERILAGEPITLQKAEPPIESVWIEQAVKSNRAVRIQGATINGPINLEQIQFTQDFELSNCHVERPTSFAHSTFSKRLVLTGSTFYSTTDFSDATFCGEVLLGNAYFTNGPVSFRDSHFMANALAAGVHFATNVVTIFSGAIFERVADLSNGQFGAQSRFDGTSFRKLTSFVNSEFSGMAVFYDSEFLSQAVFIKSRFEKGCVFTKSRFGSDTIFSGSTFASVVNFDLARFAGPTVFAQSAPQVDNGFIQGGPAIFEGIVSFNGASFTSSAEFREVQFGQSVSFDDVSFVGNTVFQGTQFKGKVTMAAANFGNSASFGASTLVDGRAIGPAVFKDRSIFTNMRIAGIADFRGTVFAGSANFGGMEVKSHALFSSATFDDEAIFGGVQFFGESQFYDTQFKRDCSFIGCNFRGNALFGVADDPKLGGARFDGSAQFIAARFSQAANFDDVVFSNSVSFSGSTFLGLSVFRRTVFAGDADFQDAVLPSLDFATNGLVLGRQQFQRALDMGGCVYNQIRIDPIFLLSAIERSRLFERRVYNRLEEVCRSQGEDSRANSILLRRLMIEIRRSDGGIGGVKNVVIYALSWIVLNWWIPVTIWIGLLLLIVFALAHAGCVLPDNATHEDHDLSADEDAFLRRAAVKIEPAGWRLKLWPAFVSAIELLLPIPALYGWVYVRKPIRVPISLLGCRTTISICPFAYAHWARISRFVILPIVVTALGLLIRFKFK